MMSMYDFIYFQRFMLHTYSSRRIKNCVIRFSNHRITSNFLGNLIAKNCVIRFSNHTVATATVGSDHRKTKSTDTTSMGELYQSFFLLTFLLPPSYAEHLGNQAPLEEAYAMLIAFGVLSMIFPVLLCIWRYHTPFADEKYRIEHKKWAEATKRRKESKKASRKASKELADQRKNSRKNSSRNVG